MKPSLLQLPDPPANPGEATVGFRLPLGLEVAGRPQRKMHTLVEVVAGLPIVPDHLIGDVFREKATHVVEEVLILGGQSHA